MSPYSQSYASLAYYHNNYVKFIFIIVGVPDLAELDKLFNSYVSHFQSFGSLPYYYFTF